MSESRYHELVEAVKRAGTELLHLWPGRGHGTGSLGITEKADGSLVSQADFQSNEIVLDALMRLFPDDAILSEETPINPDALAAAKRVWVVDPLDGTSSFLHGRDDFSILVGLCEDGVPTYGIMFFPARGKLVLGAQGRGATVNGKPLHVSSAESFAAGRTYIRHFECTRPEVACPMRDSGLALYEVASGELDALIIRMRTHREWDLAAPMAILAEAGATITDETGAPVRCGYGMLNFQYLLVSNGRLHSTLTTLIPAST